MTIASSDSAASPHTDAAMLEAHRAVQEQPRPAASANLMARNLDTAQREA